MGYVVYSLYLAISCFLLKLIEKKCGCCPLIFHLCFVCVQVINFIFQLKYYEKSAKSSSNINKHNSNMMYSSYINVRNVLLITSIGELGSRCQCKIFSLMPFIRKRL